MDTIRPRRQTELSRFVRVTRQPLARLPAMISRGLGPMVAHTVSCAFSVSPNELHAARRCSTRIARARQVAMYLAHVGFGLNYSEAGLLFGRDRTTVSHACQVIEDRRDDPRFDASLDCLEQTLRARLQGVFGAVLA